MKLYLVRHAEAVEREAGLTEENRYLTPAGREFFRKSASTLLKNGAEPGLILTSPLVRAVQTSEILAEKLAYTGLLPVAEELAPGFDLNALQKLLGDYGPVKELALVGHEPDLSNIITSLLSFKVDFALKKGTIVKLKIDPTDLQKPATFKWMIEGRKVMKRKDLFPEKDAAGP